jgi:hypothetical protein
MLEVKPDTVVLKLCGIVNEKREEVSHATYAGKLPGTEFGQNFAFSHCGVLTVPSKGGNHASGSDSRLSNHHYT